MARVGVRTPWGELTAPIFATSEGLERPATVVFIHSLGLDHTMWSKIADHLGGRCAVISCDLRGHGRSPRATSLRVEEMAQDLSVLLESLERGPAVVVGMSLGGCVAQALAIAHPEQVAALLLIDTTAWYGPDSEAHWEERVALLAESGFGGMREVATSRWFSPEFLRREPAVVEAAWEIYSRNDFESYAATCRALGAMDLRDGLSRIAVPTTILVGSLDTATPPQFSHDLHARIPGSRLEVLEGAGHFSAIERGPAIAAAVSALLEETTR